MDFFSCRWAFIIDVEIEAKRSEQAEDARNYKHACADTLRNEGDKKDEKSEIHKKVHVELKVLIGYSLF